MNTILGLDIGTEFVKAVLARPDKKGKLEVLGIGKAKQAEGSMFAGAVADIPAVVATCEEALSEAEKQSGVRANTTVVGIAGELVKGNTTTVNYTRKNSNKPISEAEMNEIIKKVQQKSGEVARKTVAIETGNDNVEVRLINSAIVSLTIDGYKISNPVGFKGSELSIQFYTAFAPMIHVAAIEKVCAELNLDLLTVAVEPFAVCRACLGDDLDTNLSAIVMDIGGGTTDVAVIEDGGVEGTKMFSIGGRSFTHQVAESLGLDAETAEEKKLAFDSGDLDDREKARVETALSRNLSVWFTGVEVALEDFGADGSLPRSVLLCGGGASLSLLQESLAISDWYKNLAFSRRPVIHLIDVADLPDYILPKDSGLDHSYATALGLLRVGVDTLAGAPEENKLRAKIAKLLQN
ncbi:pilus assembly protein PilM, partial [Candidatus Saccharibacteria bacterium]|nr:pilus assembly protein PilM [Candidatus Saccharibacteria bacterium]MBR5647428.1 pilus assembly protein PilM [Candidatus Saccharibacteria bacterium]